VCIDLIVTLKRPFKQKESYMPAYIAFSLLFSAFQATMQEYFEVHSN